MRPTGNVRSVPIDGRKAIAPVGSDHYQRGGIIAAIVVALALFLAAWAVNGYFTARTIAGLGGWLRVAWLSWGSGWCLHLAISVIEQHAWKVPAWAANVPSLANLLPLILIIMWALAVIVGSMDALDKLHN
jgi:hypothetical protein